ncbi:MAG: preQ(1) synthase [Bacteroidia bacterium]|nr:preQ(1) synthase [Bacteroidia bacterium]
MISDTPEFASPYPIQIADTRQSLDLAGKAALLKTFDLLQENRQLIEIKTQEFSAVCPGSGLPDIGTLTIQYIPNKCCIELKSLKYYLFSFRNDGIFQEPVTDIIFSQLWDCLEPFYLHIQMRYNTRGGFDTTTTQERGTLKLN